MKTVIALAILALGGFPSCKKGYTCDCTWTVPNGHTVNHSAYYIEATSKTKAQEGCNTYAAALGSAGGSAHCKAQ